MRPKAQVDGWASGGAPGVVQCAAARIVDRLVGAAAHVAPMVPEIGASAKRAARRFADKPVTNGEREGNAAGTAQELCLSAARAALEPRFNRGRALRNTCGLQTGRRVSIARGCRDRRRRATPISKPFALLCRLD
jgi:hypothetical protein